MTVIFSVVAFVIYHSLLLPSADFPSPTHVQTFFLLVLACIQAISFGCGITFAVYGKEIVNRMTKDNKKQAYLLYGSIVWLLAAWLPYSLLLMEVGVSNMTSYLIVSYVFQILFVSSGLIVAYCFIHPFFSQNKK